MSSMKEFMESEKIKSFLAGIREMYNNEFPDDAISEETLDVSVETFDRICKNYQKLEGNDCGSYIASCLATYMMLFHQTCDDIVTLDL